MFKNHADMVAKLAKPGEEILPTLNPEKVHLLHMAMGLAGETGESLEVIAAIGPLNMVKLTKELGDIEFYIQGIRQGVSISYEDVTLSPKFATDREKPNPMDAVDYLTHVSLSLSIAVGRTVDMIKKHVFYDKPLDKTLLVTELNAFERCMASVRIAVGLTREQVIDGNIDKLSARYTSGSFSNKQAIDRADEKQPVVITAEKIPLVTQQDVSRWTFNHLTKRIEITARTPDGVLRDFFYSVNEISNSTESDVFRFINNMVVDKGYHK